MKAFCRCWRWQLVHYGNSQHSKTRFTARGLCTPSPSTAASSILQLCSLPPPPLIVPQSHNFRVHDHCPPFNTMAAPMADRLIDLTPPPSVMASSFHRRDQGDDALSADHPAQHTIGQSNVSPSQAFVAAPGQSLETEANNYNNRDRKSVV